ncbi:MAG: alpha-galactosidase [Bacteroidales bacterium]|nr:alpha-galactosidase [Bacteroidales bacterium]
MKYTLYLFCLTSLILSACTFSVRGGREFERAEDFFMTITSETSPALGFVYEGAASDSVLSGTRHSVRKSVDGQGWKVRTSTFRDDRTGLIYTVDARIAPEFPVVEWTCYIENTGKDTTGVFSNILAADLPLMMSGEGDYTFRYSLGSHDGFDDFALKDSVVTARNGEMYFNARAGWSSYNFLPFFNIHRSAGEGVIASVGWAGQWKARFTTAGDVLNVESGLEKTNLRLYPGEKIRTPLMMMLFWNGECTDAHNVLRRYIVKYSSPKPSGKDIVVPISFPSWGGTTTEKHLANIAKIKELDVCYDNYWIDAGWFGGPHETLPYQDSADEDWYGVVGDWNVNTVVHPDGLKVVSDAAHEAGMKFLLWFELERAVAGTPVAVEHPEWMLHLPDSYPRPKVGKYPRVDAHMIDLGNEEAYQWLLSFVSRHIEETGIDILRNDNNTGGLKYWTNKDAEDRQGMTEIRYITNLYRLLDELLERYPDLIVDNCAGGGHRLELEMLRRSVALHRTDYTCHAWADPIGCQLHAFGIMNWIPYSNTGTAIKPYDSYSFRSNMNAGLNFNFLPRSERGDYLEVPADYPWDWFRKMMRQHAEIKDCFNGDYFPLTEFDLGKDVWCAYQLYKPEEGKGFILAFRREECTEPVFNAKLGDIEPDALYGFVNFDTGEIKEVEGSELISDGFTIILDEPRSSALIKMYRKDQ